MEFELTVALRCPAKAALTAGHFLNFISSVTGLRFKRVEGPAQLVYGQRLAPEEVVVPARPRSGKMAWQIVRHAENALALPDDMSGPLLRDDNRSMAFDLFAVMEQFLWWHFRQAHERVQKSQLVHYPEAQKVSFYGYISLLLDLLRHGGYLPENFKPASPWPNGAPFAVGISHDVDILRRRLPGSVRILARSLFGRVLPGGVSGAVRGLFDSLQSAMGLRSNPYCAFGELLRHGFKATIFVFGGPRHDRRDPKYGLPTLKKQLAKFSDEVEIALHSAIGSNTDTDSLMSQRSRVEETLGVKVTGVRPHFLDCQFPDFWLAARGFEYSSSLGFDSAVGAPGGLYHPFWGLDLDTGKSLDILELPLALMDMALMAIPDEKQREMAVDGLVDLCAAQHGLLVLDWHNTSAYAPDFPGWLQAFEMVMDKAKREGAFITSLGEINRYWRKRCELLFSF